jgi:Tfp pilus assembly protein PilO
MRSNERMIFVGVAVVALALGFYLMVLSPKRAQVKDLDGRIDSLNASISTAEAQTTYGEQARQDFPKYYGRMVVLGKAVPAQADTASLLVQLSSLTHQTHLGMRAISVSGDTGSAGTAATAAAAPAPPPATPTGAASSAATTASTSSSAAPTSTTGSSGTTSGSTGSSATTTAAPAPATEATAASLPIGATVGAAGLPTLPYDLSMRGDYFHFADFLGKIDDLVEPVSSGSQVAPDGRLLTVGGFSLQLMGSGPTPRLKADIALNAYSTGDQGLTLGASASAPAPTTPGETSVQPASAVVPK